MPGALLVVKATIAPELELAFNEWYDTVRAREAARVPGLVAMRRYAAIDLATVHLGATVPACDRGTASGLRRDVAPLSHAGAEPWQYMVCYEFDSEESLRAFLASDTLRHMTRDYDGRFGGAGERARFAYRQIYP